MQSAKKWRTCSAVGAQQAIGPLGHGRLIHQMLVMILLHVFFRHIIRGHAIPVSDLRIFSCRL